jgi:exonuclease VII small subunit
MTPDALLYVMAAAILISAAAMVLQALLLLGTYKSAKAMRDQVTRISGQAESFIESAQRNLEQSRKQLSDVAAKAGAVLDLAQKQLVRIDGVLGEASSRASIQMERVDLILDEAIGKLDDTVALLNKGLLRPVREINAVAAGLQAALGYLFRGRRLTVERATHDEEMFI